MAIYRKAVLATLAGAAVFAGGCAAGPYHDGYGYNGYYGGTTYYDPYYSGPSVGLGLGYTYFERDGRRYYRDRDGREYRDNRDHRDYRDYRDREARRTDGQREWQDRNHDSRPDVVVPDGVNRGGDLGTGRDPRANPNNSPG